MFLRSDTSMAVLSAIPVVGEDGPLSIRHMETARRVASALCADDRILLHGHAVPNLGRPEAALDAMDAAVEQHPMAAWKVYTHGPGPGWWLDDHEAGAPRVGRAFLDRARQLGVTTVCVHKGFSGGSRFASPEDVGPAAAAHPDLAFVVYHSGYEVSVPEGPFGEAGGGVDRLVASLRRAGVGPGSNVYAELGSTWWNVLRDPTRAAHVLGKLLVAVGEDNVLWGTDSIWYGSPQDQIQAFRAFEIGEELQELHGYPALTPARKAKILGANAARLYGVEPPTTACEFTREELEEVRRALPAPGRTWGPTTASQVRAWRSSHGWL
ncbi:MAG: amidohydrolase [Acidimicrobiia bacterium]|nr:amidohydrolase [Acidimicrobiia bacterium]